MIGYASWTGTRRNAAGLAHAGWRWLVTPHHRISGEFQMRHALDNGAWRAFKSGTPFDADAFKASVARFGATADFIVVPDIVMGGLDSLVFSRSWLSWLRDACPTVPLLIAVQNGMTPADVSDLIDRQTGLFIGGDTDWKEATLPTWGDMAQERGAWAHCGRVNTARRIALCAAARLKSFDGSGVSKFIKTLPLLDGARRQWDLFA